MISPAIRLYVYAAAALMLFAGIYSYHRVELNGARKAGYQQARAEMAAEVAKANADAAETERRRREQSAASAASWESERNELQSQITGLLSIRHQPIRLCKPASGAPVSRVADPAGRADGAAAGSVDAVRVGDDIGRAAVVLAGECERYRQQLSALQAWVTSLRE